MKNKELFTVIFFILALISVHLLCKSPAQKIYSLETIHSDASMFEDSIECFDFFESTSIIDNEGQIFNHNLGHYLGPIKILFYLGKDSTILLEYNSYTSLGTLRDRLSITEKPELVQQGWGGEKSENQKETTISDRRKITIRIADGIYVANSTEEEAKKIFEKITEWQALIEKWAKK
jgi:hypothetical protein